VCTFHCLEGDRFEFRATSLEQQPADRRQQRDGVVHLRAVADRSEIRAHALHFTVHRLDAKEASRQLRRSEVVQGERIGTGQPAQIHADPEHGRPA
jgi:DMSO/TMAO reductase YedYZ molybdopterin-dependent catalytic subunit